jgi:hypothetical protein
MEARVAMDMLPVIQSAGGNPIKIIRANLKMLKSINTDDILPEMSPEQEAEQIQKMQVEQAKQVQLLDLQIQEKMGAVEAYKAEQMAFNMKQQKELATLTAQLDEIKSLIYLNIKKAKTEEAKTLKILAETQAQNIENNSIEDGIEELLNDLANMPDEPVRPEQPMMQQPEMEEEEPEEPEEEMPEGEQEAE